MKNTPFLIQRINRRVGNAFGSRKGLDKHFSFDYMARGGGSPPVRTRIRLDASGKAPNSNSGISRLSTGDSWKR